jgi:hypothetical protein
MSSARSSGRRSQHAIPLQLDAAVRDSLARLLRGEPVNDKAIIATPRCSRAAARVSRRTSNNGR